MQSFPEYTVTDEGVVEERVSMPSDLKIYHKIRIPKVMFLAVTARPPPNTDLMERLACGPSLLRL